MKNETLIGPYTIWFLALVSLKAFIKDLEENTRTLNVVLRETLEKEEVMMRAGLDQ